MIAGSGSSESRASCGSSASIGPTSWSTSSFMASRARLMRRPRRSLPPRASKT